MLGLAAIVAALVLVASAYWGTGPAGGGPWPATVAQLVG